MAFISILTGAGISAESGVPTFRDSNGLWNNYSIEEVATPKGWLEDPQLVWKFYQERRKGIQGIKPNGAHYSLVDLENKLEEMGHEFCLITQNIDGLHLIAGSKNVIEIHGALRRFKCQKCGYKEESEYTDNDLIPCPKCEWVRLRPDVVWFDEMPHFPEIFINAINKCTHFASIGTSGEVYPAAGFIYETMRDGKEVYFQNIERMPRHLWDKGIKEFQGKATEQVPKMCKSILESVSIKENK